MWLNYFNIVDDLLIQTEMTIFCFYEEKSIFGLSGLV